MRDKLPPPQHEGLCRRACRRRSTTNARRGLQGADAGPADGSRHRRGHRQGCRYRPVLQARDRVRGRLGADLRDSAGDLERHGGNRRLRPDPASTARRALRYAALALLAAGDARKRGRPDPARTCGAPSMTAEIGALCALVQIDAPETRCGARPILCAPRGRSSAGRQVVCAQCPGARPGAAARIEALMGHPDFKLTTPNRVYALIGGFTSVNLSGFHAADGEGYRVVADAILRSTRSTRRWRRAWPPASAAGAFWTRWPEGRPGQLERILASPGPVARQLRNRFENPQGLAAP